MKKLIVTIDGPSGTGKSTAARRLARRLNYLYLDTGAMYRAVALKALRRKISLNNRAALTRLARATRIGFSKGSGRPGTFLDGKEVTAEIRHPAVSLAASRVATVPGVRKAMVRIQRRIGAQRGVVAEGRDTGTVVFPKADLKVFLAASAPERARRRRAELKEMGHRVPLAQVLREVRQRDRRDREREISPLRPARGAVRLNNTKLRASEVFAKLVAFVEELRRA